MPASFLIPTPAGTECQSVTEESAEVTAFVDSGQLSFDTDLFPNGNESYGFISGKVSATEGRSGSETLGTSDGTAYQQFAINDSPIIDGTLKVFVDGEEWTEKDSLASSESDDKHYYIHRRRRPIRGLPSFVYDKGDDYEI